MATIEKEIVINASTEQIDRYALDATTWPQWFAGVQAAETDGQFPQVGGQVRTQYRSMGVTFELMMTTSALQIGDHVTFQMAGMINGEQRWHYEPVSGGTKVVCVMEYELPGGGLGAIADKLLFQRTNSASIEESLSNLKRVVEG